MICNDFSVADAMNCETGRSNVIFVGTTRKDKSKRVVGLNWHGPDPLMLHFHLDLAPLPDFEAEAVDEGWSEDFSDSELDEVRYACEGEAPADEVVALEGLPESEFGRSHRLLHPDFPHQSTLDRFNNEEQFKVYRQLGVNG